MRRKILLSRALTAAAFLVTLTLSFAVPRATHNVYASAGAPTAYADYLSSRGNTSPGATNGSDIVIPAEDYKEASDAVKKGGYLSAGIDSAVTYAVNVPNAGYYSIYFRYRIIPGGGEVTRSIAVNGKVPFKEAGHIFLPRFYKNENSDYKTQKGNQSYPRQIENIIWYDMPAKSADGYIVEPLLFYFETGQNTLTITALEGAAEMESITLAPHSPLLSYGEYINFQPGSSVVSGIEPIVIQAEDAFQKTTPSMYPVNDRTSPLTEPYHSSNIVLNALGGVSWQYTGETAFWEVNVPKAGFYKIGLRYKQSLNAGMFSSRTLFVNGKVPFAEAYDLRFHYDTKFHFDYIHDSDTGTEFLIYLDEGINTIALEASMKATGSLVSRVQSALNNINAVYRQIISITSTTPDKYRDYQLGVMFPDLSPRLAAERDELVAVTEEMNALSGDFAESNRIITRLVVNLEKIIEDPDRVASFMADFKVSISAIGGWIEMNQQQPLMLDRIVIAPDGYQLPRAEGTFLQNIWHGFRAFIGSWTNDYNSMNTLDEKEAKNIEVWVSTGRDQYNILSRLVAESFSNQHGIGVTIKLVDPGVVFPATLTGKGPDIILQAAPSTPINFGYRDGAYDLTTFPDFEEVASRFLPAAVETFSFDGQCFALPDMMSFSVMFYRTDVFADLGIEKPETMDEFLEIVPILQKNSMDIYWETTAMATLGNAASYGATRNINSVYLALLYRFGGSLYENNGESTNIANDIGLEVFRYWTEFYTKHNFLTVLSSPTTRFRLGDVPVIIADFQAFNTLSVGAPEIRGNWDMAMIPGSVLPDGEVRYDLPVTVSGALMVKNSVERKDVADEAWEFLKWWTSEDTQTAYAREMESILGLAGRFPVANLEAFKKIPWGKSTARMLEQTLPWCRAVPQVPGSYITGRAIHNAWYSVVITTTNKNPVDEIFSAADQINLELSIKRKEFGIE